MSRFRKVGWVELVKPHVLEHERLTRDKTTGDAPGEERGVKHKGQASRQPNNARKGGSTKQRPSRQARRKANAKRRVAPGVVGASRFLASGGERDFSERIGAAAQSAGRSMAARGGRQSARLAGRGAKQGGRLAVRGARKGAAAARKTARGTVRAGKTTFKAARAAERNTRRVTRVAAHIARVAVAKVAAVLGAAVSSVGGAGAMAVVAVIAAVLLVVSLMPTWMSNWLFHDDAAYATTFVIVDDYPWADKVRGADGQPSDAYYTENSETGYMYGTPSDFVYWRINRDMGAGPGQWKYKKQDLTPAGTDALQWLSDSSLNGWKTITKPSEAQPGDIIAFRGGVLGQPATGMAGYVGEISDGTISMEYYEEAQYGVRQLSYDDLRGNLDSGDVVIRRNPDLAKLTAGGGGSPDKAVDYAMSQIGTPYGRGEGHGSVDCCWLVHNSYLHGRGIKLPMSIPGNPIAIAKCEYAMYSLPPKLGAKSYPLSAAKPGDIVFFQTSYIPKSQDNITHVALYVGNGRVIDALPAGGVQIRPLTYYHTLIPEPRVVRIGE